MPALPAFVPRDLLVEPEGWRLTAPVWRDDVDPAARAAAQLQHLLALRLRAHIKTQGWDRGTAAERLHMSRGSLWRLLDGYAPLKLIHATAWAAELDLRLELKAN